MTDASPPAQDRRIVRPDRRAVPRGGRRAYDRPGRFPNVLVADGYDGARIPYTRYLHHFGFHVEQAIDGESAKAVFDARRPHVLLADAALAGLPAIRLAAWLRTQASSEPPVSLILTLSDLEAPAVLPPSAAVLVKPFSLSSMLEQIRHALRSHPFRC